MTDSSERHQKQELTDHQKVAVYIMSKLFSEKSELMIPCAEAESIISARKWLEGIARGVFKVSIADKGEEDDR